MNKKNVGNIPIEVWQKAFGQAVAIAIDKDYFSDTLFYDLYPNTAEEAAAAGSDDVYQAKWNYVEEAFKIIFGCSSNEACRWCGYQYQEAKNNV